MRSRRLVAAAVTVTALAVPATASAAEELAAVTNSNKVLTFGSDSPGNIDTAYAITGLPTGEKLVGIDTRPATGQLYALGKTGRLYVLDPASGATRAVTGPLTPALSGSTFGFNFNPMVDRIRITTDTRQNYRVDPDTGAATVDAPLAYAPGQGGGATPAVGGVAYNNPVPNTPTTALFDIEASRNSLVSQNPPNAGTLTTIGTTLGPDVQGPSGFDISTSNIGWASFKPGGTGAVNLYQVNLAAGKAENAAASPAIGTRAPADDTIAVATLGAVANDKTPAKLVSSIPSSAGRVNLSKGRSFLGTVSLNESGRIQVDFRVGKTLVARGKSEIFTRAGAARIRIRATAAGQNVLTKNYTSLKYRFSARDRAGNLTKNGVGTLTLR